GVDVELPAQPQAALLARAVHDAQPDRAGSRIALQHLGDAVDQVRAVLAQLHPQPDLAAGFLHHLLDAKDLCQHTDRVLAPSAFADTAGETDTIFAHLVPVADIVIRPHDALGGAGEVLDLAAHVATVAVAGFLRIVLAQLRDHAAEDDLSVGLDGRHLIGRV